MRPIDQAAALLEALTEADVAALPPPARRRFADQCRRCAQLAEPHTDTPKAGVLADLKNGARQE